MFDLLLLVDVCLDVPTISVIFFNLWTNQKKIVMFGLLDLNKDAFSVLNP